MLVVLLLGLLLIWGLGTVPVFDKFGDSGTAIWTIGCSIVFIAVACLL